MDLKRLPRSRLPGTVLSLRGKGKGAFSHHSLIIQVKSWIKEKFFLRSHVEFKAEPGLQETHLTLMKLKCSSQLLAKHKLDIYHSPLMNTDKNLQP